MKGAPLYKRVNGSRNGSTSYILRSAESNGRWRVAVTKGNNVDDLRNLNQATTAPCMLRSSRSAGLPTRVGWTWEVATALWQDGIKMDGPGVWQNAPEIACAEGEMGAPASFVFGG